MYTVCIYIYRYTYKFISICTYERIVGPEVKHNNNGAIQFSIVEYSRVE